MQFVNVGDAVLHVEARLPPGQPVIVFINSLGSDFRIWDEVARQAQAAGYGTVLYDFRGHGLSDLATPPRVIDDHAGDLRGLLSHLGVARAHVVGVSVGGMIALGLAGRAPEAVASLALCCTGAKIGTIDSWNARIAAVESGGVGAVAEAVLQRWFPPEDYARGGGGAVALSRNMLSRTPAASYNATCVALRDSDLTAVARAVRAPTLCIAGEFDTSTPPALVRELAELVPGARYVEIAGAGHLPCLQKPAELTRELLAHLGGAPSETSQDRYRRGLATRERTLGAEHVQASLARATGFDADFQRFITEGAWGSVWSRPDLTPRERSMITVALLAAGGHEAELALHTRATRNTGASPRDLAEALLHVAVYAGVPAANTAFRIVKETLAQQERPK